MVRKIFSYIFSLFLLLLLIGRLSYISAQTTQTDLESCFTYYDYGKIHTNLATEKNSYSRGETVKIQGTIVNSNKIPLVDVVLYAHIKRINETATFNQNGHYLIDRLTLAHNLNFLPGETKGISANFLIPPTYPNGKYQIHYFIFSKNGFHYGGRPFLEEDVAGFSTFEIINNQDPTVFFDINSLKVNNVTHNIREQIYEYNQEPLTFEASLNNQTSSAVPVSIRVYSFEDTFETHKVTGEERTIPAGSSNIKYIFTPKDPGAYVMLFQANSPLKSILKYRFAISGSQSTELRMNDLGITNYLPNNNKDRAYVCFHSPTPNKTLDTKVTLFLLDEKKQLLDSKTITQSFTGDVMALSLPLTKLINPNNFWIKAEIVQPTNPSKSRTVEIHYDENTFKDSVTSVDGSYSNGNLVVKTNNNLGGSVDKGYIESVRIKDAQDKLVQEAYNLTSTQKILSLAKLPAGQYTAEVISGTIKKQITFSVSSPTVVEISAPKTSPAPVRKQQNILLVMIVSIIIIGIVGFAGYYFWQKKKKNEIQ
jgi:hypothetical protein